MWSLWKTWALTDAVLRIDLAQVGLFVDLFLRRLFGI